MQFPDQSMSPSVVSLWTLASTSIVFCKFFCKLCEYGFIHLYVACSLFTNKKGNIFMALLAYFDNIILVGNDSRACAAFKGYLDAASRVYITSRGHLIVGFCFRQLVSCSCLLTVIQVGLLVYFQDIPWLDNWSLLEVHLFSWRLRSRLLSLDH